MAKQIKLRESPSCGWKPGDVIRGRYSQRRFVVLSVVPTGVWVRREGQEDAPAELIDTLTVRTGVDKVA